MTAWTCFFGDSLPAEPAAPFVTEIVMAELYLQQGFTAEALDVYRQLSAQFPGDENLKERVSKLERGDRTSLSLDVIPEQQLGTVEGAVPLGAMFDPPEPVAAEAPIADAPVAGEEPVQSEDAPHTARSYFAALSARRAVQGNGRKRASNGASAPRVSAPHISMPAPTARIVEAGNITSLDQLFAGGTISDRDVSMLRSRSRRSRAPSKWAPPR